MADDPTITSGERLLRRVPPLHIVPDPKFATGYRVSSAAFDDTEMSVDLAAVRVASGEPLTSCLAGHDGYGLVSITAGLARTHRQEVRRDPIPENLAHGLVVGAKTRAVKKAFYEACVWVHDPRAL